MTQLERCQSLREQIQEAEAHIQMLLDQPASSRQSGPCSLLSRLRKQVAGWYRQLGHAQQRVTRLNSVMQHHRQRGQQALAVQQNELQRLWERYQRFCQENTHQVNPPRCKMRTDAGFASGENLTELIELGYDVETKSGNPAVLAALRSRVTAETVWTPVGKNAEMVAWTDYHSHTCPYPLIVGLERFHTPQGELHAVLVRYQDEVPTAGLDLVQWFHDYNGRQIVEAGNKEEKTTFKVQHLMSHSPAGIEMQALLTVFAANFVRWADHWVRERVEYPTKRFETALGSPKRLVRVAANSPATVEHAPGREVVRFSPLSSFGGVVIRLSASPGHQLPLPFVGNDHFDSA
jgi:phage host-nuclease inhibitor protein Gam